MNINTNKILKQNKYDFSIFWNNYAKIEDNVYSNFNQVDISYFNILSDIIHYGIVEDHHRSHYKKLSLFNAKLSVNISEFFPVISLKKTNYRAAFDEQSWFMSGSNNVNDLPESSRFVWDKWADENGSIKQAYGKQLVNEKVNQLTYIQNELLRDIKSTRLVIDYWNPETAVSDDWALPPCHYTTVFKVQENEGNYLLNAHVTMRSSDVFLGLPFNLCQYGLLMQQISEWYNSTAKAKGWNLQKDMIANTLSFTLVDAHIYSNQVDAVNKMFSNILQNNKQITTPIFINTTKDEEFYKSHLSEYKSSNYNILNYLPLPFVKCPVVV